jgi:myo-inositol 2-dehydrogenase/D-chiro-inositol 1-dehydrogenase
MSGRAGLRVAIVGCGRMGAQRAASATAAGASVVGCADADVARAQALCAAYDGSISAGDLDDLPWSDIDAVFVCTPPSVRTAAVTRALDAHAAILVEKPIGLSAEEGKGFADAAARAGVVNAVGYMNRYRLSVRKARDVLAGRPVAAIMCHWACKRYAVPWWGEADKSGGPFNEQATHLVDLCRFVVGDVDSVAAVAAKDDCDGEGMTRVAAALRFSRGAVGTLCYTCDAPDKFIAFEAVTDRGALQLTGWDFALTRNSIDASIGGPEEQVFDVETRAFLRAAADRDQGHIASSFADAVRTQALVDDIRTAMAR